MCCLSIPLLIFFMSLTRRTKTKNKNIIGILQTASHPALDAARDGFIERVRELFGNDIDIVVQNAQGSLSVAHTIAQQMHNDDSVVGVCAIATLATQAISHVEKNKPIFITAVSDPHVLGVVHPGTNVCGTSDTIDVPTMVQGLTKLIPHAKKVALLFNPAEANSAATVERIKAELEAHGITWSLAGISSETEMPYVVRTALQNADAMLLPPDNTVACAIKVVGNIAWQEKKPVILSDKTLLGKGILGVAGGVDYKELGKKTAECAFKVLQQKIKPEQLMVRGATNSKIFVNKETCEHLGLNISEEIKKHIIME